MTRHKYRAQRTSVDGISFASKAEATRYVGLKMLQRAGAISGLQLQPKFPCKVNGVHVCRYTADFSYVDAETGQTVIEDVKGYEPDASRLRRKLAAAVHGVEIRLVDGQGRAK